MNLLKGADRNETPMASIGFLDPFQLQTVPFVPNVRSLRRAQNTIFFGSPQLRLSEALCCFSYILAGAPVLAGLHKQKVCSN
jgi:hypothetical protein